MTKAIAPSEAAIRACPYVAGVSTRFRAEPTKLSPLAGKMMLASGAFSTRREGGRFPLGRISGAIVFLSMAIALGLGGDPRTVADQTETAGARALADDALALAIGYFRGDPALERSPDNSAEAHERGIQHVDNQARFEIARLIRLSSAERLEQNKAERSMPGRPPRMAAM